MRARPNGKQITRQRLFAKQPSVMDILFLMCEIYIWLRGEATSWALFGEHSSGTYIVVCHFLCVSANPNPRICTRLGGVSI